MSTQDSHDREKKIAYYQSEPRPWEIKLRPVGYSLVTIIWFLLTLITLGLAAVLPLAISDGGNDPHMVEIFSDQARDPANATLGVAVMVVLVGPVLGYALVLLPLLTAPLAALSATYVVRSLRPSYRRERLSATGWSRDTVGPVTVGPTALSLLAVTPTRWTRFWMRLYSYSWGGGGAALFIQAPFTGLAYIVTVCWLLWPVHGVFVIAGWSLLSIALATPGIVLAVRRTRRDGEAKEARRPAEQDRRAVRLSRSAKS